MQSELSRKEEKNVLHEVLNFVNSVKGPLGDLHGCVYCHYSLSEYTFSVILILSARSIRNVLTSD